MFTGLARTGVGPKLLEYALDRVVLHDLLRNARRAISMASCAHTTIHCAHSWECSDFGGSAAMKNGSDTTTYLKPGFL